MTRKSDHHRGHEPEHRPVPPLILFINLMVVIVPFAALIVAIIYTWGWGFNLTHLAIFAAMYLVTGFGVTIGYHRLFTHRSFQTGGVVKSILGVCGSMAVEGPILAWVADHRYHHQHSDHENDPHSPHLHGEGFAGLIKGLWHAQMGWLFARERPNLERYVGDLKKDRVVRIISDLFPLWVVLSLAIPAALGGLLTWSWWGVLIGFLGGGLARICIVHHLTWSINSICHVWGARPFKTNDESRNNAILGVLAMGEGWHNNHHAFPRSARHGLKWWQLDVSYIIIKVMERLGLVWNVQVPAAERVREKQRVQRDRRFSPPRARRARRGRGESRSRIP